MGLKRITSFCIQIGGFFVAYKNRSLLKLKAEEESWGLLSYKAGKPLKKENRLVSKLIQERKKKVSKWNKIPLSGIVSNYYYKMK